MPLKTHRGSEMAQQGKALADKLHDLNSILRTSSVTLTHVREHSMAEPISTFTRGDGRERKNYPATQGKKELSRARHQTQMCVVRQSYQPTGKAAGRQ